MTKNIKFYHIAALVAVLLSGLFSVSVFKLWREKLTDLLLTDKMPPNQIVIVVIDEESINEIGQWPWPRAVFASAIQKLQSAKVIGVDVNFKEPSSRGMGDDLMLVNAFRDRKIPIVLSAEIQNEGEVKFPLAIFKDTTFQGFTNLFAASDGVTREFRIFYNQIGSFSFWIAKSCCLPADEKGVDALPVNARIRYFGKNGSFSTISFRDVISGKIPESFIRDKIVLIGATVADLQDYHQTPVGIMSGVEIQANMVQTILDGKYYHSSKAADIVLIAVLALLVSWLSFRVKKLGSLIAGTVIIFVRGNI